jgi:UDP-N-acetylglucosamine acyltransferase
VQQHFDEQLNGVIPMELSMLLTFIENQKKGKLGRAREAVRNQPAAQSDAASHSAEERKAA